MYNPNLNRSIQEYVDSMDQEELLSLAFLLNRSRAGQATETDQDDLMRHLSSAVAGDSAFGELHNANDEEDRDETEDEFFGNNKKDEEPAPILQFLVGLASGEYIVANSQIDDLNVLLANIPDAVSVVNLSHAGDDIVETAVLLGDGVELAPIVKSQPARRGVITLSTGDTGSTRGVDLNTVQDLVNALNDVIDRDGITDIRDINITLY